MTEKDIEQATAEYDRAVKNDDAAEVRKWGTRVLAMRFPERSTNGLKVDPGMFGPYPLESSTLMGFNTSVLVETEQVELARAALAKCQPRFMSVSQSGEEYLTDAAYEAAMATGPLPEHDIPSWVSDPDDKSGGVAIVFDSSWMQLGMKVTLIEVVLEELRAAGVTQATITSDPS